MSGVHAMKYLSDTEVKASNWVNSLWWILEYRFEQNAEQMNHPLYLQRIANNREEKTSFLKAISKSFWAVYYSLSFA